MDEVVIALLDQDRSLGGFRFEIGTSNVNCKRNDGATQSSGGKPTFPTTS